MKLAWMLLALLTADGGVDGGPDASAPVRPAPMGWRWINADGGWLDDAGVTDVVTMRVGDVAELQFPVPIMLMQCDEPLVTLGSTIDTLLLKAVSSGHTHCGFWYQPQAWPHRTLELFVSP